MHPVDSLSEPNATQRGRSSRSPGIQCKLIKRNSVPSQRMLPFKEQTEMGFSCLENHPTTSVYGRCAPLERGLVPGEAAQVIFLKKISGENYSTLVSQPGLCHLRAAMSLVRGYERCMTGCVSAVKQET